MKPEELSESDRGAIREGIRRKYAEVAQAGTGCGFRYPTGKEGLTKLGYPPELLQGIPDLVLASFCGVGNPFSLGPINPGETVLDIGCGVGVDTLVAARLVGPTGRVVGIDATAEMIARAHANLALTGLANVGFAVASAEALPFPDGEFEVALSNGVFNLLIDKEQALSEAYRVLKPGSRLMLADMVLVQELPKEQAARVENWYQWIGGALPGRDFLALLLKVGFNRAGLVNYTGFKSSPYTEGALFLGEKLDRPKTEEVITCLEAQLGEPQRIEGLPGRSG